MSNNKYLRLHSLLRMFGALLAIIIFISMFIAKQVVRTDITSVFYDMSSGAFFGDDFVKGNVLGFFAYLFVLLGGLAGLAFVFIDDIIGKDLTDKLSYVAGGVVVLGAIFILLFAPIFKAINGNGYGNCTTAAAPIVFGILALIVGAINISAPILEKKIK
ncbi:MAG: hypothetical protein MJ216_02470 [Bacilli bacterium]|nr:hypothetical protein [Bacilli bacterium]